MNRAGRLVLILSLAGFAAAPAVALADGEAGLVIQHGDGTIESYCIPFSGQSISGDDLLRRAGVAYEHVSGLVCSVGADPAEGCRGASSFDSCTCRCRSGGSECVYWAYFTRQYGRPWVYSALGLTGQSARDGDLQAWKWGRGGPSSAPVPADITFEQVCGHAPGGNAATPLPPTPLPTATTPRPVITATPGPASSPAPASTASPAPATPAGATATGPLLSPTPLVQQARVATVPGPAGSPSPASAEGAEGGGTRLVAFSIVAAAVIVAAAAGAAWRARRDG